MKDMRVIKVFCLAMAVILAFFVGRSFAGGWAEAGVKDIWGAMDAAGKAYDKSKPWIERGQKGKDLWDKYPAMSDGDKQADPNYNPPGMPQVPTSCDESKKDGCKECYVKAYNSLYKLRMNFEELRAVRISTENFTKSALAFGDSVSGVHGVAGIEWQAQRRKIEASFKNFEKAYRNKHQQLVKKLEDVLKEIDKCEAEYYDEKDWYNRFGYMYFSFMEDRYRW